MKKGVVNFTDMGKSYCSAEEILPDKDTDIEAEVMNKMFMETVLEAISILSEEEKLLIHRMISILKGICRFPVDLFFENP